MIASRRSRILLVIVLWAVAGILVDLLLWQRPISKVGVQILISVIAVAWMYCFAGRQAFWSDIAPYLLAYPVISVVPAGPGNIYHVIAIILFAIGWVFLATLISGGR